MAQTIEDRGSGRKWHWDNVQADLRRAGAAGLLVEPLTVREHSCGGTHAGQRFYLTWLAAHCALLTTPGPDRALVRALSAVLGYEPYCCCRDRKGLLTVEWLRGTAEQQMQLGQLRARGLDPQPWAGDES